VSGRVLVAIATAGLLAACAPIPRPNVLGDLERLQGSPVAAEAKTYAPDALARAQKLRGEAEAAFASGDTAGAELLGERALAAYAHAGALARVARAQATTAEARTTLATAEADLASLDADQARVAADADALDLKLRVARDAQAIQPSGKADPERERARLAAARALAVQARLLCGAARLLAGAPAPQGAQASPADPRLTAQLDEASAALAKVDEELSAASVPAAPIDGASRARAGCLAALTALRRAQTPVSRGPGLGDALLAEISATGSYAPARDDRGVVVTLRGLFSGGGAAITPAGEARLAELGKIAAAHPSFPALVVLHTDKPLPPRDVPAQQARAEAVAKALAKSGGGAVRVSEIVAGGGAPVADPAGPERARNARVEIVFVTPEGF
jgi:outer membrane protein OmpA-like peptidoglycan-associated protein